MKCINLKLIFHIRICDEMQNWIKNTVPQPLGNVHGEQQKKKNRQTAHEPIGLMVIC